MAETFVLRVVHVLGGMFWVGSALFNTFYLFPAMGEAGPAAGPIMGSMRRRHLYVVMPTVALLTILSGVRLMWMTSGGFPAAYFATGPGAIYGWSGAAAIVAFMVGVFVQRPTGMRMGEIQQALAKTTDEHARADMVARLERLQRRNTMVGRVLVVLLIAAATGMAVGRYVP
jgi:uncharacterized membrane protein